MYKSYSQPLLFPKLVVSGPVIDDILSRDFEFCRDPPPPENTNEITDLATKEDHIRAFLTQVAFSTDCKKKLKAFKKEIQNKNRFNIKSSKEHNLSVIQDK